MDWAHFSWGSGLAGGILIGLSAALLLTGTGRIAGISGVLGGLVHPARGEVQWRVLFAAGLLVGGALALWLLPGAYASSPRSAPVVAIAGLLVGVGTRIGNGCTSGHGVCGLSRGSARSLVATLTFMATGALTALAVRVMGGAS
jgi:uncharacterized protein